MADTILELDNLKKGFDGSEVLTGISLSVMKGEFLTILGPSGCGKTTTLRIIAGLTAPDEGRVLLSGRDVTSLPPEKRNVNTVFQNYALFPHMSVEKNIAYGLRMRGASRQTQRETVKKMLSLVALEGFEKRMPAQLSGGQRQRVAIARSVALEPEILLLDEPLGALDLKLRQQMQSELKRIQTQLGISFIYITHDQDEALNMSDRIAIMNAGRFEQIGTPEDIYERPETRFAARFIGSTFLLEGTVTDCRDGLCALKTAEGDVTALSSKPIAPGKRAAVSVHCERIELAKAPRPGFTLRARVLERRYTGSLLRAELALDSGTRMTAHAMGALAALPAPGETVFPCWRPDHAAIIAGEEA